MPEFYDFCPKNIFPEIFFWGEGGSWGAVQGGQLNCPPPLPPVFYAYAAAATDQAYGDEPSTKYFGITCTSITIL